MLKIKAKPAVMALGLSVMALAAVPVVGQTPPSQDRPSSATPPSRTQAPAARPATPAQPPAAQQAGRQAQPLDVPAGRYALDPAHASMTWRVNHLGLSLYTARFTRMDSSINLDPRDVTNSTVEFTVDTRSVRTDFPTPEVHDFDATLRGTQFLSAEQHPQARFVSRQLVATGPRTGRLTGDLTLRGVTRPVTFDVALNAAMMHPMRNMPAIGFSARGTVRRSEFGMTHLVGPIGDEVELIIESEYLKAD